MGVNRGRRAVPCRVPARQRAAARAGAGGLQLPLRTDARRALRAGAHRPATPAPRTSSSRATRSTTPTSTCRPTIRSFRASSSRATSSSPASTARCSRRRTLEHGADRLQPDAHRPERRGQHLPAAASRSCRGARSPATSTSAACKRFGPQSSANLRLVQNVFSLQDDLVAHARAAPDQGRRPGRALPGQHGQPDVQPRHLRLPEPAARSSRNVPTRFVGLTPEAQFDRVLALHAVRLLRAGRSPRSTPRLTAQRRPALRVRRRMPADRYGRDSALPDLTRAEGDRRAALREPDLHEPLAARRRRVGRVRRRPDLGARRLRALLQHQQPAEPDRHGHQPAVRRRGS